MWTLREMMVPQQSQRRRRTSSHPLGRSNNSIGNKNLQFRHPAWQHVTSFKPKKSTKKAKNTNQTMPPLCIYRGRNNVLACHGLPTSRKCWSAHVFMSMCNRLSSWFPEITRGGIFTSFAVQGGRRTEKWMAAAFVERVPRNFVTASITIAAVAEGCNNVDLRLSSCHRWHATALMQWFTLMLRLHQPHRTIIDLVNNDNEALNDLFSDLLVNTHRQTPFASNMYECAEK